MFKLLIFLIFLLFTTVPAQAGSSGTCYLPKGCEVVGSEFSTGGGKSLVWYVEVLCRMPDGVYRTYLDGKLGFRLLGRLALPKYIEFIPSNRKFLECHF